MSAIVLFVLIFIVGLAGSVYTYAQPAADNWCVIFVFMFIVGAIGFIVALILHIIHLIKGRKG